MRLAIAFFVLIAGFMQAGAAERIVIHDGGQALRAILYRPAANGPVPAVVALHGCGGFVDNAGRVRPQYQDWGERLAAAGFAVLFPDSYASRGLGSQCRVQNRSLSPARERVTDAFAARAWLQGQDWVQPDRISLLGWSNGAIATLWTIRPQAAPKDGRPDFRSAAAFYPGCRRLRDAAWSSRIPALILVGGADDWTPARDCEQMVAGAKGRSAQVNIIKYRGAHHGFDRANLSVHQRTGLAFTSDGSGRAHVGGSPDAREDAIKRIPRWFNR